MSVMGWAVVGGLVFLGVLGLKAYFVMKKVMSESSDDSSADQS